MRLLALAAVLLVVVAILATYAWSCQRATQRWDAAEAAAQWETVEHAENGVTRVYLKKIARTPDGRTRELGERIFIQAINDSDSAWKEKYQQARQKAYDRAIALNYPV